MNNKKIAIVGCGGAGRIALSVAEELSMHHSKVEIISVPEELERGISITRETAMTINEMIPHNPFIKATRAERRANRPRKRKLKF